MKFKKLQTIVTGLNKMSAELFELDQVRGDIFVSFASDKAVSIATTIGIKVEYEELYIARGGICSHEIDTYDVNQLDIVDLGDKSGELKIAKARYLHGQAFTKAKMDMLRRAFGDLAINKLESLRYHGDISEAKLMEYLQAPPQRDVRVLASAHIHSMCSPTLHTASSCTGRSKVHGVRE